jgi:hypothetical protein
MEPMAPGTCHPAYADKQEVILNWLANSQDSYYPLLVPYMTPLRSWLNGRDDPANGPVQPIGMNHHTLRREKAAGPAPYVGRPFVYVWHIAVDELGRQVAGPAERVYTSPF